MKINIILLYASILFFSSCEEPRNSDEKKDVNLIKKYRVDSGTIYVYKFDNDTIYLAEGYSKNYPISIEIKK